MIQDTSNCKTVKGWGARAYVRVYVCVHVCTRVCVCICKKLSVHNKIPTATDNIRLYLHLCVITHILYSQKCWLLLYSVVV